MSTSLPSKHFNVVLTLFLGWCDVVASHDVKSTWQTSVLEFTTLNNVESTLPTLTMTWTTSDNFETTLSFSMSIFRTLDNVKTTLWIWSYEKKEKKSKPQGKHKIIFWASKKNHKLNTKDLKLSSLYCPFLQEYIEEYLQSR